MFRHESESGLLTKRQPELLFGKGFAEVFFLFVEECVFRGGGGDASRWDRTPTACIALGLDFAGNLFSSRFGVLSAAEMRGSRRVSDDRLSHYVHCSHLGRGGKKDSDLGLPQTLIQM